MKVARHNQLFTSLSTNNQVAASIRGIEDEFFLTGNLLSILCFTSSTKTIEML